MIHPFKITLPNYLFVNEQQRISKYAKKKRKEVTCGIVNILFWKTRLHLKKKKNCLLSKNDEKHIYEVSLRSNWQRLLAYNQSMWFAINDLKRIFPPKGIEKALASCHANAAIRYDTLRNRFSPRSFLNGELTGESIFTLPMNIGRIKGHKTDYSVQEFKPNCEDLFIDESTLYIIVSRLRRTNTRPRTDSFVRWIYKVVVPTIRIETRIAVFKKNQDKNEFTPLANDDAAFFVNGKLGESPETIDSSGMDEDLLWCKVAAVDKDSTARVPQNTPATTSQNENVFSKEEQALMLMSSAALADQNSPADVTRQDIMMGLPESDEMFANEMTNQPMDLLPKGQGSQCSFDEEASYPLLEEALAAFLASDMPGEQDSHDALFNIGNLFGEKNTVGSDKLFAVAADELPPLLPIDNQVTRVNLDDPMTLIAKDTENIPKLLEELLPFDIDSLWQNPPSLRETSTEDVALSSLTEVHEMNKMFFQDNSNYYGKLYLMKFNGLDNIFRLLTTHGELGCAVETLNQLCEYTDFQQESVENWPC